MAKEKESRTDAELRREMILAAAMAVLRQLQHHRDGLRKEPYCVVCAQAGGCHPKCELAAVLVAFDAGRVDDAEAVVK